MNEKIKYFLNYLHKYSDNERKLRELQIAEAKNIVLKDGFTYPPETIAGIDVAYKNDTAFAVCVTSNFKDLEIIENKMAKLELKYPYKPGFFVFREGPPILEVISKLKIDPNVILINAHGICHPLGIGAASHIGVLLGKPTIGVAQRLFCGSAKAPKKIGDFTPIFFENKIVGYAYLSKLKSNIIYISPGHLITPKTSLKIIKHTISKHKLPEPLALAHINSRKYYNGSMEKY